VVSNADGSLISTSNCLANVPQGEYYVNITDLSVLCTSGHNFAVPDSSLQVTSSYTNSTCFGTGCSNEPLCNGSIDLAIQGAEPYDITWTSTSTPVADNVVDPAGLCPGYYSAYVVDAHGCSEDLNFNIGGLLAEVFSNQANAVSNANYQQDFGPILNSTTSESVHFVTANTTRDETTIGSSTIHSEVNIVVVPGVTLTMQNIHLEMARLARIRVLPGGKIVANNSTFKGTCGTV